MPAVAARRPGCAAVDRRFRQTAQRTQQGVDVKADQLSVLEALLVEGSAQRKFLPTLPPIENINYPRTLVIGSIRSTAIRPSTRAWISPPRRGTTINAAASGKVIYADFHPATARASRSTMAMVSSPAMPTALNCWSRRAIWSSAASASRGRLHRPLHRAAFALRSAAQWRAAESSPLPRRPSGCIPLASPGCGRRLKIIGFARCGGVGTVVPDAV